MTDDLKVGTVMEIFGTTEENIDQWVREFNSQKALSLDVNQLSHLLKMDHLKGGRLELAFKAYWFGRFTMMNDMRGLTNPGIHRELLESMQKLHDAQHMAHEKSEPKEPTPADSSIPNPEEPGGGEFEPPEGKKDA